MFPRIPMPFFSIIIPVYNVQKYIARCLDSVVNQSFKDIEIIIVDDCGNDDSIGMMILLILLRNMLIKILGLES